MLPDSPATPHLPHHTHLPDVPDRKGPVRHTHEKNDVRRASGGE